MRFEVGQKFVSKENDHHVAKVVDVRDEGREAWIEMRNVNDELLDTAWVSLVQFLVTWVPKL